jgi:hypothetical protein
VFALGPSCGAAFFCGTCERCDALSDTCVVGPRAGCLAPLVPGKSQLQVKRGRRDTSDAVSWTWTKGAATTPEDFGNPAGDADYALCIFDESGAEPALVFGGAAPAGGTCGRRDCWRGRGRPRGVRGWKYSDRERTPDGLSSIDLKPGADGKARIAVKGRGPNLTLPALPMNVPLRVQLQRGDGGCWESAILPGGVRRTDEKQFRGKAGIP